MVRSDERWTMYWIKMRVPNVVCRRKGRDNRQPITDYGAVGLIIRLLPKTMSEGRNRTMHDTAYTIGGLFFELYWRTEFRDIVEIGSYNVNGTLRELRPPGSTYISLDFEDGPGVDLRIRMHEKLPLENQLRTWCWLVPYSNMIPASGRLLYEMRITRAGGFIYVNAPSKWLVPPLSGRLLAVLSRCRRGSCPVGMPVRPRCGIGGIMLSGGRRG